MSVNRAAFAAACGFMALCGLICFVRPAGQVRAADSQPLVPYTAGPTEVAPVSEPRESAVSSRTAELLRRYNLDASFLEGARFPFGAYLQKVKLSGRNLRNAVLDGADLSQAELAEADLSGAQLNRAVLYDASLRMTNFRSAQLWYADLRETYLCGADFSTANLNKEDGVNEVEALTPRLEGAKYNDSTKWPPGFEPDKYGAIKYR